MDPLHEAIATALGVPSDEIDEQSSAERTPQWDSVGALNIIFEIEARFGVSVPLEQAVELRSTADWRRFLVNEGKL